MLVTLLAERGFQRQFVGSPPQQLGTGVVGGPVEGPVRAAEEGPVLRALEIHGKLEFAAAPAGLAVDEPGLAALVHHRDLVRERRIGHGAKALGNAIFRQHRPTEAGGFAAAGQPGVVAKARIHALNEIRAQLAASAARGDGNRAAHRLGAEAGRGCAAQDLDALDLLRLQRLQLRHRRSEAIDEDGDAPDTAHGDDAVVLVQSHAALQHLHEVGGLFAGDVGGGDQGGVRITACAPRGPPP